MIPAKKLEKFWARVKKTDGCWLWCGSMAARYGYMSINGQPMAVHRISASIAAGRWVNVDEKVLHTCDNVACVRPDHLKIGTQRDNVLDMVRKGRGVQPKGEHHGASVLTEKIVKEARQYRMKNQKKWTWQKLAELYECSESAIRDAVNGVTWKHV